jgi:hypothetical protein
MYRHKLTASAVGEMVGRKAHTVRVWRCASTDRSIPEHTLTVLKLRIAERERAGRA